MIGRIGVKKSFLMMLLVFLHVACQPGSGPAAVEPAPAVVASAAEAAPATAAAVSCTHSSDGSIQIVELEVTQALPNQGNYIPGKSTAVIAHLDAPAITQPVTLTGNIQVWMDGELFAELTANNWVTLNATVGTNQQCAELVFEPILLPESSSVVFDVTVMETASPNVVLTQAKTDVLSFSAKTMPPLLFYTRIDFVPSGLGAPDHNLVTSSSGDSFARAVLPIAEDSWFYRSINDNEIADSTNAEIAPITVSEGMEAGQAKINSDKILSFENTFGESQVIFERLATIRNRIILTTTRNGIPIGANELLFLHGWITDPDVWTTDANGNRLTGVVEMNGAATASDQRVSYSSTAPAMGQLIYAHELLHNIMEDAGHVAAIPVTNVAGWDVDDHLRAGWPITNPIHQRKQNYFPIMAHQETDDSWVYTDEYSTMLDYFSNPILQRWYDGLPECEPLELGGVVNLPVGNPCLSENNYVFSGALEAFGSYDPGQVRDLGLDSSFPVQRIPWFTQPTYTYSSVNAESLPFRLIFESPEWEEPVRIPFDARIFTFPTSRTMLEEMGIEAIDTSSVYLGFFQVLVPPEIVERADSVRVAWYPNGIFEEPEWDTPYLRSGDYEEKVGNADIIGETEELSIIVFEP